MLTPSKQQLVSGMRRARWLAPWKDSNDKPAIYHCISRVVERRLAFGPQEKERFRVLMRMMESFSGCRVLSYCIMSNHFHLLLEVPPMPLRCEGSGIKGLSDQELIKRLSAIYPESTVAHVAVELQNAQASGNQSYRDDIHARYTYRMNDLGQFMKTLLQRFTQWFNGRHERTGRLWEDRFKSVIVESGTASRSIAAYIDLNPLRARMVEDPADYRWSSYGEAVGGGTKGGGKKAREGLVRACMSQHGVGFEVEKWKEVSRIHHRNMGYALQRGGNHAVAMRDTERDGTDHAEESIIHFADMLRHRVRYFTDGAVIGSKEFVNEVFSGARERFAPRRRDGARRMRGGGKPAAGVLWSMRDLRVRV